MKFVRLVIALHASHRYGGIPSSNLSAKVPAPTPGGEVTTFRPLEVVADRGPPEPWAFQDDFDQRDSTW